MASMRFLFLKLKQNKKCNLIYYNLFKQIYSKIELEDVQNNKYMLISILFHKYNFWKSFVKSLVVCVFFSYHRVTFYDL